MKGYCYLKVFLLPFYFMVICLIAEGSNLSNYTSNITNRILKGKSLPFEDCGSKYLILNLNISSCTSIPCTMNRGSLVQVSVLFDDTTGNTSYLKHHVRWVFNTIRTEAKIIPEICDGLHPCLSDANEGKLYNVSVLVTNSLPIMSGAMIWKAVNEYSQDVVCFRIPVLIIM